MTKQKLNFSAIDMKLAKSIQATESQAKGRDFVNWGDNNDYPQYLYDIYQNCATLQSIINGCADYTYGNGIVFKDTNLNKENQDGDTLEEVISKLILDRWIFGGFAFQVIYNILGQIVEILYLDFKNCRTDEKGTRVFYSKAWSKWGYKTQEYPAFNLDEPTGTQIFYYKGKKTRGVYPVPDYAASLISAETQIEIQKFHKMNIVNGFMVNSIINFNNGIPEDAQKNQIEEGLNDKFSGADNAGRVFVSWNEDKEKAVTVERLGDENSDKKYEQLADATRENIFISMRATPALFGMVDKTGFNSVEYEQAFKLFNKTVINSVQKEITKIFEKVFGIQDVISIEPFKILWEDPINE